MNADRIAQAYYGDPAHPSTQRCRRRIHWMCAQASGSRVIDIGCSQGILSLILAREGFDCTGVDLEDGSLDWARQEAAKEPELVRKRVRFQTADATALPFDDGSFDTAYLGEILEHLTQPARVLQEVRRVVKPGGRVVVTVPLGLHHVHSDHKQVYYPTSLARMVRPFFRRASVAMLDSFVTYAGINDLDAADTPSNGAASEEDWANRDLESYCAKVESDRGRLRGHLRSMKAALRDAEARVAEFETRAEETPALQARLHELEQRLAERDAALTEAEATAQRLTDGLREKEDALAALAASSAAARRQLEDDFERRLADQNAATIAAVDQARSEVHTATLRKARREAKATREAEALRQFVRLSIPASSRVLVVSKGDDRLVQLDGRTGVHFPQSGSGGYAGFHPPDGQWAVAHLQKLRAAGAGYLLVPASAFWWLEHYAEFREHLAASCAVVAFQKELGLLVALKAPETGRPDLALPIAAARAEAATMQTVATLEQEASPVAAPIALVATPSLVAESAVSEPMPRPGLRAMALAAVLDPFTSSCLKPEARLITFRPDNWRQTLDRHPPDAVFVESAWQGNDGAWRYRIASYPTNKGDELVDLVRWARGRRIPTVFWNKEDPVHFDRFIERGGQFDHVFTTDADCVDRYRAQLGHNRVHDLPFAAQPLLHNPVQIEPRAGKVCFAGTYYGDRHDERRRDLEHILVPALDYGLDIYDRRFGVAGTDASGYAFPPPFQPAIRGRLEYDDMVKAYKRYRVFLNVNSVKSSPTMFSRRVFELLACGTPVISSYARGLVELLGEDVVFISESEADTRRHLDRLLNDEQAWARASLLGMRRVLEHHTYGHRLETLCDRIGLPPGSASTPRLSVVARVADQAAGLQLADAIAAQSVRPAAVVIAAQGEMTPDQTQAWRNRLPGVPVQPVTEAADGALEQAVEAAAADWVALVDDRDHYGPHYLQDYALAAQYSPSSELLGKQTFCRPNGGADPVVVAPGGDFRATWSVASGSLVAKGSILSSGLLREALRSRVFCRPGADILSIDRFNYLQDARPAGAGVDPRLLRAIEA